MKRILTLFSVSLISLSSFSQKECNKWFFGSGAALDFNSGAPVPISSPMYTSEGTASVCDGLGRLRFFTNGDDVYDSTKTIMPNGTGLLGDVSTTQSAVIVPNPNSSNRYYIFTAGPDGDGDFGYSEVDMTLNGGLGDVVVSTKNTVLIDSATEKIAAVRDESNGIWIVTHKFGTADFYAYHLTTSGLSAPVISNVGSVHNTSMIQNSYGQLKFNNCGTRLACAIGYQDLVELFDFNLSSGVVSNPMSINMTDNVYGVEFSPSGNLLYVSCYDVSCKLAQFNISLGTLPAIIASKVPLSVTDDLYGLQAGPDGKIYVSRSFTSTYLGVISSPNLTGFACSYSDTGLDLDPSFMGVSGALSCPNFMQSYLKVAVGATCLPTSVSEASDELQLQLYPNPSTAGFSLDLSSMSGKVMIYDHTGKLVEKLNADHSILKFGETYSSGIYLVNVVVDGTTCSRKVVKQ